MIQSTTVSILQSAHVLPLGYSPLSPIDNTALVRNMDKMLVRRNSSHFLYLMSQKGASIHGEIKGAEKRRRRINKLGLSWAKLRYSWG